MKRKDISKLHLPHNKNTAAMATITCLPPQIVRIPLKMHSGAPCVPVVKQGDKVKVGQLIATCEDGVFAPIHASVSGTVKEINEKVVANGRKVDAIVIESDGKMELADLKKPEEPKDLNEFLECVKNSGCVGLGGAAYPTWHKLAAALKADIPTFLINGAECEPYLTGDTRTMLEKGNDIKKGIELLRKYLGSSEFNIGIEENKPECISSLSELFKDDPQVHIITLHSSYPQGAKQVLLYMVTGKVQKPGTRLAELGVLIINVTSLTTVANYMETGMPLVSRTVTVDGNVNKPGNYNVPIGSSVGYVLELAGGLKENTGKVIIGGPMMGHAVTDLNEPLQKADGGVIAFTNKDSVIVEPTACIHCGRCVDNCPLSLNPTEFARAMAITDEEERLAILKKEQVTLCMQCGCCSYVCPAHRPLVQTNVEGIAFVKSKSKR